MIIIHQSLCIGCGSCAADCVNKAIRMENGRPVFGGHCIDCGHCAAICPTGAVTLPEYDMTEALPLDAFAHSLNADALLGFIQARRTVRHFQTKPVETEKLEKIIQAGRYTPTGSNRQGTSFIVVTRQLEQLRRLLISSLADMGRAADLSKADAASARYAGKFIEMERDIDANTLFFGAQTAIFVVNDSLRDGALAASHMELMVYAQDLGMLYCGFATLALEHSVQACRLLGLPHGRSVAACMLVGYPNVSYVRLPPRKKAQVTWL